MNTNMENKIQFFSGEGVAPSPEREKDAVVPSPAGGEHSEERLFLLARTEIFALAIISLGVLFYGIIIEEKPVVVPDVPVIQQRGYAPSTIVDTPLDANKQKGRMRGTDSSGAPLAEPPVRPNTPEPTMSPTTRSATPNIPTATNTNPRTPQSILLSVRERLLLWHEQTGSFSGYATTNDPTWQFSSPAYPNCTVTPFINVSPMGQDFEADIRPDCGEVSFVYCIDNTLNDLVVIPFSEVNSAMMRYRCQATQ